MNPAKILRDASRLAFTRAELLVALAVGALLLAVVLPALANNRWRSDRVTCANNLRQIGVALQVWGNDHRDQIPWHVEIADGGTRLHPLSANTWFHFAWLSNELASPRLAFCPSDTGKTARDFSGDPTGGYLHPNFRNQATSYFLNAHPYNPTFSGNQMVAGDRNIPMEPGGSGCSMLAAVSFTSECPPNPAFGWTNGLHKSHAGNLLMFDGQVEQANNDELRSAMDYGCRLRNGEGVWAHFAVPR